MYFNVQLREAIGKLKPEDSKAEKPVKQVKVVKPAAKKEKEGKVSLSL